MKTSVFLAAACLGALLAFTPQADALVYDLTTQSTVAVPTSTGTAIFTTDFTQPAGTGVIDPFLTIQANGVEQGYNSSAGDFDTKREPQYNHEVKVSDLVKVNINGTQYYSFLLDINEPNSADKSQISLDALKIYTSTVADQTTTNLNSLGTQRFDLDLPTDNYILYNDLNSGSGQADIAFFIPVSAFAGAGQDDYVYMYQMFGQHVSANFDGSAQGGFEETAIGAAHPVPEMAALLPLACVLGMAVGAHQWRRRKDAKTTEFAAA
jgi:hypothetical protein